MKTIQSLLDEYGESHQNRTNKIIHWICVPLIFFSITGLLYSVSLGVVISNIPLTLAHIALLLVLLYYMMLSPTLSIGMLVFTLCCLTVCNALTMIGARLWMVSLWIFVLAWIGQFIGHHIEGKKPSFLKDVQFLLIGPAWLMSFVFRRLGMSV